MIRPTIVKTDLLGNRRLLGVSEAICGQKEASAKGVMFGNRRDKSFFFRIKKKNKWFYNFIIEGNSNNSSNENNNNKIPIARKGVRSKVVKFVGFESINHDVIIMVSGSISAPDYRARVLYSYDGAFWAFEVYYALQRRSS